MAKRKKPTAKQRRMQKARERAERAAYERGEIKPKAPKAKAKRERAETARRAEQSAATGYRRLSAAETAKLPNSELIANIMRLWDDAYRKYRALKAAGISNVATSLYEESFAGMNPAENNINQNRAIATALKKWLKRKDTSVSRSKKNKKKTERLFEKEFGYDKMSEDERREFWNLYKKYVEYVGGIPQGASHYLKHFSNAYKVYREKSQVTQKQLFDSARERMMKEYEQSISADTFGGNPLES